MKILLIDDNEFDREGATRNCGEAGFEIEVVEDIPDNLADYDVVVMDVLGVAGAEVNQLPNVVIHTNLHEDVVRRRDGLTRPIVPKSFRDYKLIQFLQRVRDGQTIEDAARSVYRDSQKM